ncbi:hypothetical protein CDD81_382 [Ophiocordyceps australis]|uniref:Alanyl-transfer RNA synthetases family profile domain-containing protein n=1 Tax=Ophiocordyceps australis TaxID=1399860 RepID=A0A2C5Y3E7_9HYPO|nr:hypothetical protein CDD81_382 [Ophiocordyceps australis]
MTLASQLRACSRRFHTPFRPTSVYWTSSAIPSVSFGGSSTNRLQPRWKSHTWTSPRVGLQFSLHTMSEKMAAVQTVPVYESCGDLRSHATKIMAVSPISALSEAEQKLFKSVQPGDLSVQTSETIFHIQGGGQPSDTGTMVLSPKSPDDGPIVLDVLAVRRGGGGDILHHCRMANNAKSDVVFEGVSVEQKVDGDKRDLFSRVHTAGHVLGIAVRQLASKLPEVQETKGQHYPDDAFVQFQGTIGQDLKDSIQQGIDGLVAQDLPVKVSVLGHDKMAEHKIFVPDGFSYLSADGTRVVEIDGLGGYPCSGTHSSSTAKLGKVSITKMTTRKGATKIYYETK